MSVGYCTPAGFEQTALLVFEIGAYIKVPRISTQKLKGAREIFVVASMSSWLNFYILDMI